MVNKEIRLIIFFAAKDGEALYSQQKQDWELTVAQIMVISMDAEKTYDNIQHPFMITGIPFSMGMVLILVSCTMSRTSIHSLSGTLSIRSSPLNLFLTSTV